MRIAFRRHHSRVCEPAHKLLHRFLRDNTPQATVWPLRMDIPQEISPLNLRHEQGAIPFRRQAEPTRRCSCQPSCILSVATPHPACWNVALTIARWTSADEGTT